jgi:DNA mismatch repair protein MutH
MAPAVPQSAEELLGRAEALAAMTLGELSARFGEQAPPDLRRDKGWVGRLIERCLGATAASRSEPDFREIGVELKTLPVPVDLRGRPLESTFVAHVELDEIASAEWDSSRVKRKLARVLWIPVHGERHVPVAARRVGTPLLWSPSRSEEAALRHDWEELVGLIGRGDLESVTGHMGSCLQVRPKASSSRDRRRGFDAEGASFAALPKGFYLRATFTRALLERYFAL